MDHRAAHLGQWGYHRWLKNVVSHLSRWAILKELRRRCISVSNSSSSTIAPPEIDINSMRRCDTCNSSSQQRLFKLCTTLLGVVAMAANVAVQLHVARTKLSAKKQV